MFTRAWLLWFPLRGDFLTRSYNCGYIFGLMEHGGGKFRLEMCPENRRGEDTLVALIKKHVVPGTEIHTDCWKGYMNLAKYGYVHKTVNQSQTFVGPASGAYTQNIESSWRGLRVRLSRDGIRKDCLVDHLYEYLWRYEVKRNGDDPFLKLINDIKYVYNSK